MNRKLVGICAAALAIGWAGCGGDGSGSEPLTRAEFTRRAAAICEQRDAALAVAVQRSGGDIDKAVDLALPAFRTSVNQLAAIAPPAELQSAYDEIMRIERRQLRYGEAHDLDAPGATEDGPILHHHERQRRALGMDACN